MAELAVNNRDAASTKVSPFFLTHGYHVEPVQVSYDKIGATQGVSPIQRGSQIVAKLKKATEWAQSAIALAQQTQEDAANRTRQQTPSFRVGDKVWLDMSNIRTIRKSKKLDIKNAKFTITEVISSHSFRLNTPPGIHDVFHANKLRLASTDPLPSQRQTDEQPKPQIVGEDEEYEVEEILEERFIRRGRGRKRQFLVKWRGYQNPTWESAEALEESAALDAFKRRTEERGDTVTG